ncbi:hypothetical protein [Nafulsella turpanensis]|uniref:hypothetical protein n=1 Tax=Nafulsella turpanensis TaxID=1265690 RepID=UPI000345AB5E|nr:hypothetical protein [Nafulsella turpanensis]
MFTNSYNPQRQLLLIKRQLTVFQQPLLTVVKFGLIALLTPVIIRAFIEPDDLAGLQAYFLFAYLFGGFILTSHVFKELHSPHQSYFFLTLPASALEKLLGAWLLTVPLYSLVYIVASFIVFFTGHLITGETFAFASFFNGFGEAVLGYLAIQPIFLWGAAYFRKNNFLKTVGSVFALGICLTIFTTILIRLIIGYTMITFTAHGEGSSLPSGMFENYVEIFFWALGPYMLLTTYFTLKERQL